MGFRIPAFSDREPDKAALDLLAAAAFSASSPLYDRLVRREKACLSLRAEAPDRRDPYLFIVRAEAASEAALPGIEKAVLGEIERLKSDLIPARALDAARSGRLGALRLAMETTEGTAAAWAAFIGLTGDPDSLTRLGRSLRPDRTARSPRGRPAPSQATGGGDRDPGRGFPAGAARNGGKGRREGRRLR